MNFIKIMSVAATLLCFNSIISGQNSSVSWHPFKYFIHVDMQRAMPTSDTNKTEMLEQLERVVAARKVIAQSLKSAMPEKKEELVTMFRAGFSIEMGMSAMALVGVLSAYKTKKLIMPFYGRMKKASIYAKEVTRDGVLACSLSSLIAYKTSAPLAEQTVDFIDNRLEILMDDDQKLLEHIASLKKTSFNESDIQTLKEKIGNGELRLEGGPIKFELSLAKFASQK